MQNASCLFLVYPFTFKGKLIQYIGRVQRAEIAPTIYDYRDHKIDYLNRSFLKRNNYYRKIERTITLFDDPQEIAAPTSNTLTIDKIIKVPIQSLVFKYGCIEFSYEIAADKPIVFEIENDDIRPEFEVLKPYFEKVLRTKVVEVSIHIEFENNILVSQDASSNDISKINKELIDSVRFSFFNKGILGKRSKERLSPEIENEQMKQAKDLFGTSEELLDTLLTQQQFRHYLQLKYLASQHASQIVKIRFVLNPFSFVFLLEGERQNHIILETLDSDEATYVWHINKAVPNFSQDLQNVDTDLTFIRNYGRQVFLTNAPQNFSRIIHDYTEIRKGFVIWKNLLEEKLV